MRPVRKILLLLLLAGSLKAATDSESSFQLAPAPIPYPYFDPGTTDGKIDFSYVNLTISDYSFNGLSVYGKIRKAFTDMLAIDGMGGLMFMSGKMAGIGPISRIPAYNTSGNYVNDYYTRVDGKADASIINLGFSANAEVQVLRSPLFNAIIFAGPSLNITSVSLKTPYSLIVPIGFSNAGEVRRGYTDTLTTTLMLGGLQGGMQIDIPLGALVRISPFFVVSSLSGSGTITDDPGTKTTNAYSASFEVPASSSVSTGFDIFVNDISIGAMAQSSKSSQTGGSNSYLQLTIGYRFSSKDPSLEKKEEAKPEEAAAETAEAPVTEKKPAAKKAPTKKAQ